MDPIELATGALTPEQVRLLLGALETDVTFVDEHRKIRFYNEGFRIFSRTPDIIGTDVVACHSPETQGRIARLISELESGWRDRADFLEQHDGRNIAVSYVAVRDEAGAYRGIVETVRYVDEPTDA
jgi:DUF438 domain-containing protein